jgi:hypothetical protein
MNHAVRSVLALPACLLPACTGTVSEPEIDPLEARRKMIGLEEKFDRFDFDGNGYLSERELRNGLQTVDVPEVTGDKVRTVIEFYDTNNDGRISLRETQAGRAAGPEELIEEIEDGR